MSDIKQIVCLANSRKLSGRCIAGREWSEGRGAGNWVRPVSDREGGEVSEYERQYEDGSDPRVLDIIRIPVVGPQPEGWQTENWLLDPEFYWQKEGRCSWFDLAEFLDPVAPLWIDGYNTSSGRHDKIPLDLVDPLLQRPEDGLVRGRHDRAPLDSLEPVSGSLRLIHVERLELSVFKPGEAFGNNKRRVQGRFSYAGKDYALWVTDPLYERKYLAKLDGVYEIGECYLTVSLGEPYLDACYKLIAAVMERDGW